MGVEPINGNEKIVPVQESIRMACRDASGEQQNRTDRNAGGDPVSVSLQRTSATMGKLGNVNEENNLIAKGIRDTDKALREVSDVTGKMKSQLEKIVKNWPPFPQDSLERKNILMSYVSLRKEIEKMTFPPPPAPVYENNRRLWEDLDFTDSRKLADAVPDISENATDAQIQRAIGSIDEFETGLGEGRKDLYRAVTEL